MVRVLQCPERWSIGVRSTSALKRYSSALGRSLTFGIYMGNSLAQVRTWIYSKEWRTDYPLNACRRYPPNPCSCAGSSSGTTGFSKIPIPPENSNCITSLSRSPVAKSASAKTIGVPQ